jgi:hypothetical protein
MLYSKYNKGGVIFLFARLAERDATPANSQGKYLGRFAEEQ